MKITIDRVDDAFQMEAKNEREQTITMDSSVASGGKDSGYRPMEILLAAIGGCSSIDVIDILKKQREPLEGLHVEINGEREPGKVPSLFKEIDLHFTLDGDLNEGKVKRAVDLSLEKYCSVAKMLEKTANITYSFTINQTAK